MVFVIFKGEIEAYLNCAYPSENVPKVIRNDNY